MKNFILSIGLLLCMAIPLVSTMLWVKTQKIQIRKDVKEALAGKLTKEELSFFQFSNQELIKKITWRKKNKEFVYLNCMYDVLSIKTSSDSTYLICFRDVKETKFKEKLDSLVENIFQNDAKNQQTKKKIHQFYSQLFFTKPIYNLQEYFIKIKKTSALFYFKNNDISIPDPPPPKVF